MRLKGVGLTVLLTACMAIPLQVMANGSCPELDRSMRESLENISKADVKIIEDGVEQASMGMIGGMDVKSGACLPILDMLDGLIRMRTPMVPDFSQIFAMIADMACGVANDYIEDTVNSLGNMSIGDPYGITGISAGVSTDGSGGMSHEEYDIGSQISGAVVDGLESQARGMTDKMKVEPPVLDRAPRNTNQVGEGVRDAIKGL